MLFLFCCISFFFMLFSGVGYLISIIPYYRGRYNPFLYSFVGISFVGLYFSIISLFTSLNILTFLPVFICGFIGFFLFLKLEIKRRSLNIIEIFMFFVFIVLISFFLSATEKITACDTLLYHATVVSWTNASKIVLGLANLHGRLGMNSLYLQIAAGIDVALFDKYSSYILLGTFYLSFISFYFFEVIHGIAREKIFSCIMLTWLFVNQFLSPSLYYDVPSMMFMSFVMYELLKYLENAEEKISLPLLFVFAATSFCIKQMGAVNVLAVFFFGIIYMIKKKKMSILFLTTFVAIPVLFAAVYIVRNVLQTGYPLYPLPILRLDLPWTVKSGLVQGVYDDIKYWPRLPGSDYMKAKDSFILWIIPWLKKLISGIESQFLVIGVLSLIINMITLIQYKMNHKKLLFLNLLLGINVLFWFFSAPDFRFSSVLFYLFFAISLYYFEFSKTPFFYLSFATALLIFIMRGHARTMLSLFFTFIYIIILAKNSEKKYYLLLFSLSLVLLVNLPIFENFHFIYPPKVKSELVTKTMLKNDQFPPLEVFVPVEGTLCGDAPLPCTLYANHDLHLFVPGDIYSGYYIDTK